MERAKQEVLEEIAKTGNNITAITSEGELKGMVVKQGNLSWFASTNGSTTRVIHLYLLSLERYDFIGDQLKIIGSPNYLHRGDKGYDTFSRALSGEEQVHQ